MTNHSHYHPRFRYRRQEVFAEFGKECLRCGLQDREIYYHNGRITMCFLHIAHVFKGEEMREDAYLIPLCPTCHWFFDHPRSIPPNSIDDWMFIGSVARYFIEKESREMEVKP